MAHHEAWTTVDVAPNILFDYLSDLGNLPEYLPRLRDVHRTHPVPDEAQGLEARRPKQAVHEDVEVTAEVPSGREVHSDAWIEVVEENRSLRWGSPDESDYHGELDVDFVADGTSKLTVRLDTAHPADQNTDEELRRVLDTIKSSLETTSRVGGPAAPE
ncbi:SRPBCC family protein [Kribbella jiaozuonensis]|uniref:SRPBCC family protein n=1 Tax=Kribbella jiaozuonensis TaxID=2575441 RepID=A0A4U3LKJ8_9ACTN|nr:SRPBCC family protein [Kribbella jiaozuonensis]TKK76161.1 SRPBCC family protein [Kribbella jiaozuonensis]